MIPYFVCFLMVCLLSAASESAYKHKKKRMALFCGILSVLILSFFAGIRDYDVGTDNTFYILPGYQQAEKYMGDFSFYMKNDVYQLEPLYLIISYIAVKVFRSPHFIMFALSLLTNLFVYLGITKLRRFLSVPFAWLIYCLVYFNITLNMMRQSVAIAIVFYVLSDIENIVSWKKATFFFLLASLIHISALIGFFFYGVRILFKSRKNLNGLKYFLFIVLLLLPVLIPYLIQILNRIGLLTGKYVVFIGNTGEAAFGNILLRSIGFASFILYCYINRKSKYRDFNIFNLYVGIINILLLLNNSLVFIRIDRFFEIFEVIQFTLGIRAYSKKNALRDVIAVLLTALMLFYWYYRFVVLGDGETYPYMIDPQWYKPV